MLPLYHFQLTNFIGEAPEGCRPKNDVVCDWVKASFLSPQGDFFNTLFYL
jgi:hypothetical protein